MQERNKKFNKYAYYDLIGTPIICMKTYMGFTQEVQQNIKQHALCSFMCSLLTLKTYFVCMFFLS